LAEYTAMLILQTDSWFCSEHEEELDELQAVFEQAICHLSKSRYYV